MRNLHKLLFTFMLVLMTGCLLAACVIIPSGLGTSGTPASATSSSDQSQESSTSNETSPAQTTASGPTLTDYFPLIPDVFFDYAGTGNEYVPMTAWVEYVTDDSIQMSYDNGGTEIHRLYRISDGQVRLIASLPELYVREDLSRRPADPNGEVLLQEPLTVGSSWLVGGKTRSISAVDVPVTTPAGSFLALEVSTEDGKTTTRQYYAPGIGLVKMTVTGEYEISQELSLRELPKYRSVPMTFYYGRMTDTDVEILYKEINVEYRTNIGIIEILSRYFREPVDARLPRLMSPETKINSVQLEPETGIVTIDFSPELVTQMNAGSSFEGAIIRSIVNTVGHAYGVEKVIITLDQKLYESGHIALGPGEYFGVNYEDMVPLA